jgi:hypothetical protein
MTDFPIARSDNPSCRTLIDILELSDDLEAAVLISRFLVFVLPIDNTIDYFLRGK